VWAIGFLTVLALLIARHRSFIGSLGKIEFMADGTCRSASSAGPVLIGTFRPRIIFPTDFDSEYSAEERTLVLAHERAHIRRGDVAVTALASVWLCVFWFNPLIYWAFGRLRFDQELACDAAALTVSGTSRRAYAKALLKSQVAADSVSTTPIGCHWQSAHPLKERITMLNHPTPSFARRLMGVLVATIFVLVGGCGLWVSQATPVELPFEYSADRVTVLENGEFELFGNVLLRLPNFDGKILAQDITGREDSPLIELRNVILTHANGTTIESDRVVFDRNAATYSAEGGVRISVAPEAN
jgi:hypothetical protein